MSDFSFTIGDLSVFLNKSPVTLRSWERKGLVKIPRSGGKRVMSIDDVFNIAEIAVTARRIPLERHTAICEALYYLRQLEIE